MAIPLQGSRATYPPLRSALQRITRLLWPRLTSRSVIPRRPFRHKARSPRVRALTFSARPPDLRSFALITRASRFYARSPCSATPCIRFLFIGSRLRFTLPLHARSPSRSCASLHSLWPTYERTFTSKIMPMPGVREPQARQRFGRSTAAICYTSWFCSVSKNDSHLEDFSPSSFLS